MKGLLLNNDHTDSISVYSNRQDQPDLPPDAVEDEGGLDLGVRRPDILVVDPHLEVLLDRPCHVHDDGFEEPRGHARSALRLREDRLRMRARLGDLDRHESYANRLGDSETSLLTAS